MKTRGTKVHELNKLEYDEFGRPNGLLLVDKPVGISSHDVVDLVRHTLETRKVGHAGALDVFSSGLLMVLVGKATKWSDEILNQEKAYTARVIIGVETVTQDPEGAVISAETTLMLEKPQVESVLASFIGDYEQLVSIYSSVKVNGNKLRKVLRDPKWSYEVIVVGNNKTIKLTSKSNPEKVYKIVVPKRKVKIQECSMLNFGKVSAQELPFKGLPEGSSFYFADVLVHCSKGTYIRQLAEDIGNRLNTVAALASLRRVTLGVYNENQAIKLDQIADCKKAI